jgi:hypothetical protein
VNYDTADDGPGSLDDVALTRIYPEDISRFMLDESGIESPPWTQLPHQEESQDD